MNRVKEPRDNSSETDASARKDKSKLRECAMAAQLACAACRGGVGAVDINVKKLVFSS